MSTLQEYVSTFMTISSWIILRIKNISHKILQEVKTRIFRSVNFFKKIRAF